MKDYEMIDGKAYAVLYRDTEKSETDPCLFCGKNHKHGIGDGHRLAHCYDDSGVAFNHRPCHVVIDADENNRDIVVSSSDGYIIKTRGKL